MPACFFALARALEEPSETGVAVGDEWPHSRVRVFRAVRGPEAQEVTMAHHSLGIDIGGTFTDIVVYDHDSGRASACSSNGMPSAIRPASV